MDEWLTCQRNWLYLEPIFSSEDINRQLPVESKRYQTMERIWRKVMTSAKSNPQVISLCPDATILESLRECNKLLEQVRTVTRFVSLRVRTGPGKPGKSWNFIF